MVSCGKLISSGTRTANRVPAEGHDVVDSLYSPTYKGVGPALSEKTNWFRRWVPGGYANLMVHIRHHISASWAVDQERQAAC